ncbi:uncharacterized protein TNCV_5064401 [Trichonephila clavipes]|nr:uncharacterized protein TNCV_5064401 [Trichonephila clavipes]
MDDLEKETEKQQEYRDSITACKVRANKILNKRETELRNTPNKGKTDWCALWAGGIIGPYFKNDEGHNVTVNGDRYRAMITNFFIPELNNHDVQELWFQQDGATCHTARATIDLLKDTFGDRLISGFGPVNWPPRSCDLTPLDYFLWGYVKSLVYADKPQTLDHLEDNIRRVIADIRPQMLEKVIENWTSRLDYIRASRGRTDNKNDHSSDSCPKSIEERKLSLRKNGICYLCLTRGHIFRACKKARVCVNCKGRHSELICDTFLIPANNPDNQGTASENAGVRGSSLQCDTPMKSISCCNVNTTPDEILLETCRALLVNESEKKEINLLVTENEEKMMSHLHDSKAVFQPSAASRRNEERKGFLQ